jgi:hypothetical protein
MMRRKKKKSFELQEVKTNERSTEPNSKGSNNLYYSKMLKVENLSENAIGNH